MTPYASSSLFSLQMRLTKLLTIMLPGLALTTVASGAPRQSFSEPQVFEAPAVPYGEDHFREMASMRFDSSPYFMSLMPGDTTVTLPESWTGRKVYLHTGGSADNGLADRAVTPAGVKLHLTGLTDGSYIYSKSSPVSIRRVTATTMVDTVGYKAGRVNITVELDGYDTRRRPDVAVEFQLFDPTRHQMSAARADGEPTVNFVTNLPLIHAWNHEYPYCYMVAVVLRDDRTGRHIESMGVPLDFASHTARAQRQMLNSRPVNLFSVNIDTIPATREQMSMLLLHLRDLDYNAVMVPDPDATPAIWRHLCRTHGMLLLRQPSRNRLDGPVMDAGDSSAGIIELNRRVLASVSEPASDSTLVLDVTNRYDFTPLNDFKIDWQMLASDGRKLASGSDVFPEIEPHGNGTLRLPGAVYPLPLSEPEAFLDYTVTTPDGSLLYADQTVLHGVPAPPPGPAKKTLRKLGVKNHKIKTSGVTLTFDPTSGAITSMIGPKGEMLSAPMSLTLDSAACRTVLTSMSYHKASRTATVQLDVETMQGHKMGKARLDYTVGNDGALNIACRYVGEREYAYMRPAMWMRMPASHIGSMTYLGRRNDPNPAERAAPRIANYRVANNMSASASDVRRMTVAPCNMKISGSEPFIFEQMPISSHGSRDITAVSLTLRPAYTSSDNFMFTLHL